MQSEYKSFLTKNIQPSSIRVVRAKGSKFWDEKGQVYLDFSSQTLNLNLGNSPQIAKEAFLRQFEKFTFLSSRFESDVFMELSQKLIEIAPRGLTKINARLTNGTDANESAFKRARTYRNKPIIVTFYWSHLGESCETLRANGKNFHSHVQAFGGSSNFVHCMPPFAIREIDSALSVAESEEISLEHIEFLFKERGDIAALILEPVMMNAGGHAFSVKFLSRLKILCERHEVTLIFDEIQTAFGWLGTFFASDLFNVVPDMMSLGKGIACGFPLSALLMKEEYDVLEYGEDEYTYGGHPISCAVALAGIQSIIESEILAMVRRKSVIMREGLAALQQEFGHRIKEVRNVGLIGAVEFHKIGTSNYALKVYDAALNKGLLLRISLDGNGHSIVLKPPIIVSDEEISQALGILRLSISGLPS